MFIATKPIKLRASEEPHVSEVTLRSFRSAARRCFHSYKHLAALRPSLRCMLLLTVCILEVIPRPPVWAQSKPAWPAKSPLCTRDNAFEMIKQQVGLTKTFNDPIRRITVLIRAGDLLWPYQQDKARAAFTEAFDLAAENEKETAQKGPRSILLRLQVPDQRYFVIRAVAKRDSAWAKELTQQMLKSTNDGEASATRDSFNDLLTANRLLDSAYQLLPTDIAAAVHLAWMSLKYPASSMLTRFLYRLAEVDQQGADLLYAQALKVYGDRRMGEFLYLQAYPFAWRDTLNTPVFSYYVVPPNFAPNRSLKRQFVELLLRRAQQALEAPDEGDIYQTPQGTWMPGTVHLLEGLVRLEPQVRESLPDLSAALTQAREKILVSLSVENQKLFLQPGREISAKPDQTFDEQIESAQKTPDVNERDGLIAMAVFGSEKESLTSVIKAIDETSDSTLRAHLLEWVYFQRAATAVTNKDFEEAEKLASRVEGYEPRAYLHTEIARELLRLSDRQTHARELLDEAISEAKKAGVTIFAARTLLTASYLYSKIDLSQSIAVFSDAINCINRLEASDFVSDDQALEKRPRRRTTSGQYRGEYVFRFYMPGLDPESAFREMARIDFDTALSQSSALTDKFQRALSTLALAEVCLQQTQQQPKSKKNARP